MRWFGRTLARAFIYSSVRDGLRQARRRPRRPLGPLTSMVVAGGWWTCPCGQYNHSHTHPVVICPLCGRAYAVAKES